MRPDAPIDRLERWIAERLHPLAEPGATRRLGSDYDLNPAHDRTTAVEALQPAAVLVALVERPQGLSVILTRRADTLARHSGQVALPGGRCDADETPWDTALREAHEEVGLEPQYVRLVGLADPYETVTGFRITPVIGFVRAGFTLVAAEAEVADVFEVPFAYLMDEANYERRFHAGDDGRTRHFYALQHDERLIWGATAAILRRLHERLFGDPPD